MWNQFECMFHILAPFFDVEFRLRLCVTRPAHCIWNDRLANNGTNTVRNEFGLVITTLTMFYAVKRYWNKNINIEIPFFQRFPKALSLIYTNRLMLLGREGDSLSPAELHSSSQYRLFGFHQTEVYYMRCTPAGRGSRGKEKQDDLLNSEFSKFNLLMFEI